MKRKERVEELLLEMKDTSELMVDLAYSAVFYDSEGIAHEVQELEEEVGTMLTEIQRLTLESVKDDELGVDTSMVLLRVAQAAEVIANSALEIADVVLRDVELHPILAETIRTSDSSITKVVLSPDSRFCGPSLAEMELETETGLRILAVKRSGKWITRVDGAFHLRADDLLIAVGPHEAQAEFTAACEA